eukprot:5537754-Amphidinium_carterae.2
MKRAERLVVMCANGKGRAWQMPPHWFACRRWTRLPFFHSDGRKDPAVPSTVKHLNKEEESKVLPSFLASGPIKSLHTTINSGGVDVFGPPAEELPGQLNPCCGLLSVVQAKKFKRTRYTDVSTNPSRKELCEIILSHQATAAIDALSGRDIAEFQLPMPASTV